MNPQFPLYIPSKGRADSRMTMKVLELMGVPFLVVVEDQEHDDYAAVMDEKKLLVLDETYQRDYNTCDDLGDTKSKGAGPARNFIWDHAVANGHRWHWVMDDNIRLFHRFNRNSQIPVKDGTLFKVMEDFCLRYKNIATAGPNYFMFASRKDKVPPVVFNTRVYSCNLIRNDVPFRWRSRYNEDTDLSLRILKAGWCTAQFNAFLQLKMTTQYVEGGNTEEFYEKEGTYPKSEALVALHPDVTKLVWKFGRWHHRVDYRPFKNNRLIRRDGVIIPDEPNEYGMKIVSRT